MKQISGLLTLVLSVVAGLMLIAEAGDYHYDYQEYDRYVILVAALWLLYRTYKSRQRLGMIAFAAIAIIFNPFIALPEMHREIWQFLEYLAAGTFLLNVFCNTTIRE